MAKSKTPKAPKPPKNPHRAPPEICACSVPMVFSKTTGTSSCPGKLACSPTQKRTLTRWSKGATKTVSVPTIAKTYKIREPGVIDPISRSAGGRGVEVKLAFQPPAGSYTTQSEPCKTGRAGCPVQLVFKDSKPHVRFCGAVKMVEKTDRKTGEKRMVRVGSGEMGWIVPVETPTLARRLVSAACKQWTKAGVGPDQALGRARGRA